MRITLPYPPTANHFHAVVRGRKITSAAGRKFLHECTRAAPAWAEPSKGPVTVKIDAFRPRKAGDLDNIIKPVLDALTHIGVYEDDRQIVQLHAFRWDDKANPRVEVEVSEYTTRKAEP